VSTKFSSFDAMTRQNKINALMNVKKTESTSQVDYYLVLHAMLNEDVQVAMAAKMAYTNFSSQSWFQDFGKPSDPQTSERIANFLRQSIGYGPELVEIENPPERQQMAQNLSRRQKKFENLQEWDGPFPQSAKLLNTLREDTQQIIQSLLNPGENIEKCWLCLYTETLQPFRECTRSLESNAATMVVNLTRLQNPAQIDPSLGVMFGMLGRPAYMLVLVTGKRCILFLRDEIGTSQACVRVFNLQNIAGVNLVKDGILSSIEIETHQDFIKIPMLLPDDADEVHTFLRQRSVEAIEASEEFIERDFEKEMKKLDMLFKAHAIKSSEYLFRKSRLQKMELEKFSDANIELLLARRFSDGSKGDRFDEQLLKKFTFEKTVMFTDIVGFSSQASQKMLLDTMTLLAVHDKLLMPVIKENEGILIKKIGDALMVRFDDPFKACSAAQEMQRRLFEFNGKSNEKIFIRIGINTGTVFIKNEDVFGDAVNMAARMESLAKPGRIFITEMTMQRLEGRLPLENLGPKKVKGRDEPVTVYSLVDSTNIGDEMAAMAADFIGGNTESQAENHASLHTSHTRDTAPAVDSQTEQSRTQIHASPEAILPDLNREVATTADNVDHESFPENLLNAVDYARFCYIRSVKAGRTRNPDLEDWFARFETLLRPDITGG